MILSILIPNYGFSELTIRCLESIKSQPNNNEFEVLICDQSKPTDRQKITEFIGDISNFRLITLEQPDVLIARKTLIKHAHGDYIFYVDSDDYIETNFIAQIIGAIKKLQFPDLIVTSYFLDKQNTSARINDLFDINKDNFETYFYCSDSVNTLWRKIFKRSLFDEKVISDLHSTNGDDWIISLPIVKNAKIVYFEPDLCGYHYCLNDTSLTHTMTLDRFKKSFSLKDQFAISLTNIDYNLLFKSRMTKYLSFCIIHYRENKDRKIIKESFEFVRDDLFNTLKVPGKSIKGLKSKILYLLLRHNWFSSFFLIIKRAAR